MSKLKLRLHCGEKNFLVPIESNKTLNALKDQVYKRFQIKVSGFKVDEYAVHLEDEIGDVIDDPKKERLTIMLEAPIERRRASGGSSHGVDSTELEKKIQELEEKNQQLLGDNKKLQASLEVAEKAEAMTRDSLMHSEKTRQELEQALEVLEKNPPQSNRNSKKNLLQEEQGEPEPGAAEEEMDPSEPSPKQGEVEEKDEEEDPPVEGEPNSTETKPSEKKGTPAKSSPKDEEDPWAVIDRKMAEKRRKKKEKEMAGRAPVVTKKEPEVPPEVLREQSDAMQESIRERMAERMKKRKGPRITLQPTKPARDVDKRRKSDPEIKVKANLLSVDNEEEEEDLPASDGEASPRTKIARRMAGRLKDRVGPRISLQPSKKALARQAREDAELARRASAPMSEPKAPPPKAKVSGMSKKEQNRIKRMNLVVGDKLEISGHRHGVLKFMGTTEFSKGATVFGLELVGGALGDNSGSVDGVKYFDCEPRRGVFISGNEIRKKQRKPKPKEPKRSVYKRRLETILKEFNPHKLKSVETLLDKHEGNEHGIYVKVCTKYFVKPDKEYFDDTDAK